MQLPDTLFKDYCYRQWIEQSKDLDYFAFAEHAKLSEQETNAHYSSIIIILKKSCEADLVKIADSALKLFKMRKGKNKTQLASDFYEKYLRFWRGRESEAAIPQETTSVQSFTNLDIEKRQLDAMMTMNDAFCTAIESSVKRVKCQNTNFKQMFLIMGYLKVKLSFTEAAGLASALPNSTWSCTDLFDWDWREVRYALKSGLSKTEYKAIDAELALVETSRTETFQKYIKSILQSSSSLHALQIAIRTPSVSPSEFDSYVHEDYRVAEKLLYHFLDLLQSPGKPLMSKCLERTAACSTTSHLVDTLFMSKNDLINFKCIEVSHVSHDKVNWDGLGIPVGDMPMVASVVAEFAGGIKTSTLSKKHGDELKMANSAKAVVDYNACYTKRRAAKVFCLLHYDMTICVDVMVAVEDKYIKKNILKITLPSTEKELQDFTGKIELLLQWRDTVVEHLKDLSY